MRHNFDEIIDRKNIHSSKWDDYNNRLGVDKSVEMIPMWVADMDFNSPKEVVDEIKKRAAVGNYGYIVPPEDFYNSIISWFKKRYDVNVKKDWIVFSPGVLPGLNAAIQSLTNKNDGIIIQEPVYYPFMDGANNNERKIVNNQLINNNGHYEIDFDDLEAKCKDSNNKLMIISNPHNPVGRSWTKEELIKLCKLCCDNDVILISDEIHSDLTMKGHKHEVVLGLSDEISQNSIVMHSASKTFNLAGLQTAYSIIPNENIRNKVAERLKKNRIINMNWFGPFALATAYNNCEYYVDELCEYVYQNMLYMKEFIDSKLPNIKMNISEATYLVWVDFRGTGMSNEQIEHFITHEAHIAVDYGRWFGNGGEGFLRINLACPRKILEKAMDNLLNAFKKIDDKGR